MKEYKNSASMDLKTSTIILAKLIKEHANDENKKLALEVTLKTILIDYQKTGDNVIEKDLAERAANFGKHYPYLRTQMMVRLLPIMYANSHTAEQITSYNQVVEILEEEINKIKGDNNEKNTRR